MALDIHNFISRNFRGPDLAGVDQARSQNALMRNQVARLPQQNRLQDLAIQQQDQGLQMGQQELDAGAMKNAAGILSRHIAIINSSQTPRATAEQITATPDFQSAAAALKLPPMQITPEDTDDSIRSETTALLQALGVDVGAGESFTLAPGHVRYDASGREVARGERAGNDGNFELVPGPNGSLLQINRATGEVSPVLGREPQEPLETTLGPDNKPVLTPRSQAAGQQPYQKPTGGLSARDATTARNKLTSIALARQQIANARANFEKIRGSFSAGPAGGLMPTEAGKAFDASVDMMRSTITGLKRVPGVGAMSDYETRLDQSMLPERGSYESTTLQKLNDLDMFLNYLEQGYGGLLQDSGGEAPSMGGGGSSGWSIVEVK